MAADFSRLQTQVRDLHHHTPLGASDAGKPLVVLLHGLGGDYKDWLDPFQDRNWPYDHRHGREELDLGIHSEPPVAKLPGIETRLYMSPRLASNTRGIDGSDDRSWWNALVKAGYPVVTYSQVADLMVPFTKGPIAQFRSFMQTLQRDVLTDPGYSSRKLVIVGHSRGGLIGRAFLGDPEVKSGKSKRFPKVDGLITISSPHYGSNMALLDDKIIGFLTKIQNTIPKLPNDIGNEIINALKTKIDNYVGEHGDEIEPGSLLFRTLERQEPIHDSVRCISFGGTSPRLLRVYVWTFTGDSMVPHKAETGQLRFHWRAKPIEARGVSPVPDGLPLKLLGMDLDEITPGRGDGLTASQRCRFPPSFRAEEHVSFALSHAEELWDSALQKSVIQRLRSFQ